MKSWVYSIKSNTVVMRGTETYRNTTVQNATDSQPHHSEQKIVNTYKSPTLCPDRNFLEKIYEISSD